jgi:hypothetical protein
VSHGSASGYDSSKPTVLAESATFCVCQEEMEYFFNLVSCYSGPFPYFLHCLQHAYFLFFLNGYDDITKPERIESNEQCTSHDPARTDLGTMVKQIYSTYRTKDLFVAIMKRKRKLATGTRIKRL